MDASIRCKNVKDRRLSIPIDGGSGTIVIVVTGQCSLGTPRDLKRERDEGNR